MFVYGQGSLIYGGQYLVFICLQGSLAKKPYNPIIGETFHCSWNVVDDERPDQTNQLIYTAEQVSHHPPGKSTSAERERGHGEPTTLSYIILSPENLQSCFKLWRL